MSKKRWQEWEDRVVLDKYATHGSWIPELRELGRSKSAIRGRAAHLGISTKLGAKSIPVEERFWKFVDKSTDCWIWRGASEGRYGLIGIGGSGNMDYAHRVSWKLNFGNIPSGLFVLHKCDNSLCVNPSHLFLGTHQDNMDDMKRKGRVRSIGLGFRERGKPRLNKKVVDHIREIYSNGHTSYPKIAEEFGISVRQIARIIRREEWK